MLGGLARWLRAAGYSADFDVHIRDGELVRRAVDEGLYLLTSDSGVMERYAVSTGLARTVFVPMGLTPIEQLGHVIRTLRLPLRDSRCMLCDGRLEDVALGQVRPHVPAKVQQVCRRFFRCTGCGKVYWRGRHWDDIRRRLGEAAAGAEAEHPPSPGADGPRRTGAHG